MEVKYLRSKLACSRSNQYRTRASRDWRSSSVQFFPTNTTGAPRCLYWRRRRQDRYGISSKLEKLPFPLFWSLKPSQTSSAQLTEIVGQACLTVARDIYPCRLAGTRFFVGEACVAVDGDRHRACHTFPWRWERDNWALWWRPVRRFQIREDWWHIERSLRSPASFLGGEPLWKGDCRCRPYLQGNIKLIRVWFLVKCPVALLVTPHIDVVGWEAINGRAVGNRGGEGYLSFNCQQPFLCGCSGPCRRPIVHPWSQGSQLWHWGGQREVSVCFLQWLILRQRRQRLCDIACTVRLESRDRFRRGP